jgi:transcriptional regulator with XRE-family HTH domain
MFDAGRFRDLLKERKLSQSELARRVGVSQASIYRLAAGDAYGSKHMHRIARELGTTPAYLTGETDDPDVNAPPPAPTPASQPQYVTMQVAMPSEAALSRMFEGLLRSLDRDMPVAELARLLAKRLPIGLSQLRDLLPVQTPDLMPTRAKGPQPPSSERRAPPPAPRT